MMQGVYLKLFVPQTAKYGGKLLYEWLLEEAHRSGIGGGTASRAIAGYGRHGHLHEEHFFELADDLPVAVEFITGEAQIEQLLARLATEKISLFYLRHAVEFATT
jgi:PII-like signaling protein